MSEFSLSSKQTHFSSLLLSLLFLFFSFIFSHPLYFFYFFFFFPYLFKLLSFLSPLFLTIFLLLSVFLTFPPNDAFTVTEFTESKLSFVGGTYQAVVERLKSIIDDHEKDEIDQFEEMEMYKIVFDTSDFDLEHNLAHYTPQVEIKETISSSVSEKLEEKSVAIPIGPELIEEGNVFLYQKEELEEEAKGVKEVKPINKKVVEEEQCRKRESNDMEYLPRASSEKIWNNGDMEYIPRANSEKIWNNGGGVGDHLLSTPKSMEKSPSMRSNGSFGSMRKEKEWRRTLACKLFEERHNAADGSEEGMDMLWETYETDAMKLEAKSKSKREKKEGSRIIECNYNVEYEEEDNEDEDEEENEGQLCCLQAIKFSAGKMNLGMGKANLLKISKAFKGIGWLHHVSKRKTSH